jgi:signal transduction histidine kinase/CheY-like chemotaxis protein
MARKKTLGNGIITPTSALAPCVGVLEGVGLDLPYRILLDNLGVSVAVVSADGIITFANKRFIETFGVPSGSLIAGSHLAELFSPGSRESLEIALATAASGKSTEGDMQISTHCDARVLRLYFDPAPPPSPESILIVGTEITDLAAKTSELAESSASLNALSARVLQLQDEERRRIARDLHDVAGQELVVLGMALGRLERKARAGDLDIQTEIAESLGQVKRLEQGIRTLSHLLHPPLLDELGLVSALRWYLDGFAKRSGIAVESTFPDTNYRFEQDAETALFRVVQESLANVLRHSGSKKVSVNFEVQDGLATVSITDKGKGLAPEKLQAQRDSRTAFGVGISGMRERMRRLGGKLEISARHPGTQVLATLPVKIQPEIHTDAHATVGEVAAPEEAVSAGVENARSQWRVLIADDHEITRKGIKALLAHESDLAICGEAKDGMEVLDLTNRTKPDVVVLDLSMPGTSGLATARQLQSLTARPKIIVFTSHSYSGLDEMVRAAGCEGFVSKGDASQNLVRALRGVLTGNTFFGSQVIPPKSLRPAEVKVLKHSASA